MDIRVDAIHISTNVSQCMSIQQIQQMQPKEKVIYHDISIRLWGVISADMFILDNKQYFCIVDYNSKFPIVKKTADLSADILILLCKIIYVEYKMLKKIMSDSGSNFISDKFKTSAKTST